MGTQDQEINDVVAKYGVGAVWDAAAGAAKPIHSRNVWDVQDQWGNGDKNDPTVGDQFVRFHPARDIKWAMERAVPQALMLDQLGVFTVDSLFASGKPNSDNFFAGTRGLKDFANLYEACRGKHAKTILDIAPDLFIAQELIAQSGETVEEEFVELTARKLLPHTLYNTWMTRYRYDRLENRGSGYSVPIDIASHAGIPSKKHGRRRVPVYNPLYHHMGSATWSILELEQMAEARANGAPDFNVIATDTAAAQEDIRRTANSLAYFGWDEMGITGLINNADINHTPAAQQLGENSNPEEDRLLFTNAACRIIDGSVRIATADMVLVGTAAWCYLNETLYTNPGIVAGNTETLLEVIMRSLAKLGIKRMEWAPEMEFRQAQATQLENEHSFSQALAERWSGGNVANQNVIVFINSSRERGSVATGKAIGVRPQERLRDDVEVRYIASDGGYDVRHPAYFEILDNVGPF